MTNHPRYSPPPQQPGYSTAPNQPVPPAYAHGQQHPYNQQFDWRYRQSQPAQTPYRQPYDPLSGSGAGPIPGGTGPGPIPGLFPPMSPPPGPARQTRSRAGMLAAGALAIGVVSAGIGGAAATVVELGTHSSGSGGGLMIGGAPSVPAANMPPGSVEQVAAKVVPSVVMLETDMGRSSEEGSGSSFLPMG